MNLAIKNLKKNKKMNGNNNNDDKKLIGINRFFTWCAGAELNILSRFPTDWNRFFGIGMIIFLTGVFAFVSSVYALSTIFQENNQPNYLVVVPIAFIWGIFIFFLDRFFISGMNSSKGFWNQLGVGFPRIVIAFFLGVIISRPLELRFFQSEIQQNLGDNKIDEIKKIKNKFSIEKTEVIKNDSIAKSKLDKMQKVESLEKRKFEITNIIKPWIEKENEAAVLVNCECNGACGTGKVGRGNACKFNERLYAGAVKKRQDEESKYAIELNNIQTNISNLMLLPDTAFMKLEIVKNSQLDEINSREKTSIRDLEINYTGSLLDRNTALSRLMEKDKSVRNIVWFLSALFVFIEMAPVLSKLFTKKGSYELAFSDSQTEDGLNLRKNKIITRQEFKLNKGLINQLSRAQREILRDQVENYNNEEANRIKRKPKNIFDSDNENS